MPLTPLPTISSPYSVKQTETANAKRIPDLSLPDEFTARDLLLGILHRGAGCMAESRAFLESATKRAGIEGQWMVNTAHFELAVLNLKIAMDQDAKEIALDSEKEGEAGGVDLLAMQQRWKSAIAEAEKELVPAAAGTANIDLGSRLESRIAFVSFCCELLGLFVCLRTILRVKLAQIKDEIATKKHMLGI